MRQPRRLGPACGAGGVDDHQQVIRCRAGACRRDFCAGLQRLLDELFDERGWLSLDLPRTTGWDHDDVPAIAQD